MMATLLVVAMIPVGFFGAMSVSFANLNVTQTAKTDTTATVAVTGDTTITLEEGIRRWRESPKDDTNYRFIKYQLMVQHLLERERASVDDLFTKSWDEKALADKTLAAL